MQVRILKSIAGPDIGAPRPGSVHDYTEDIARDLIRAGHAEAVEPKPATKAAKKAAAKKAAAARVRPETDEETP